jgi:hypothetical protein|tara:strand:- start:15243 stop:15599 length:357 start_codon:yes stop_codon:yes gene_type:complete
MALIKFELESKHLILLKYLDWELIKENNKLSTVIEEGATTPFGGISLVEDIGVMIFGKPEGDFDPINEYGTQYTDEQEREIEKLFSELPMALEIVLFLQTFEVGVYKRKWNLKNWKKI